MVLHDQESLGNADYAEQRRLRSTAATFYVELSLNNQQRNLRHLCEISVPKALPFMKADPAAEISRPAVPSVRRRCPRESALTRYEPR